MDGTIAVRSVLVADAAMIALVPSAKTFLGPAPLGTTLPFIMIESISKVDRNIAAPGSSRFVTQRVQVTVVGSNYQQQTTILRAVRHAAADKLNPTVTGIANVVIHTDSAGPDFFDDAYAGWRGSQDFRVKFQETR